MSIGALRRWTVGGPILVLALLAALTIAWVRRDPGTTIVRVSNQTTGSRITVRIEQFVGSRPEPLGEFGPIGPGDLASKEFERSEGQIRLVVEMETPGLSGGKPLEIWRNQLPPISSVVVRGQEYESPEGRSIRVEGAFRLAREARRDLGDLLSGRVFGRRRLPSVMYSLDSETGAGR